jgi:hypothetical protein
MLVNTGWGGRWKNAAHWMDRMANWCSGGCSGFTLAGSGPARSGLEAMAVDTIFVFVIHVCACGLVLGMDSLSLQLSLDSFLLLFLRKTNKPWKKLDSSHLFKKFPHFSLQRKIKVFWSLHLHPLPPHPLVLKKPA